jgi:nucleoside ABC transporter ATP-binding protein
VLKGISKVYPTVVANDQVDLTVRPGEIRAILGENGAGKSTLMKIIYGVTRPSAGQIWWEGEEVEVQNPAHARSLGIGMVFQHFSLFETLTVVENVALALPGKPALDELARRITAVSERYGLPVDPRRHIHALSVGERQRVEIIRCLLQNPRLLIMDEPTSVLTPQAVRKLFETLRQLAAEGCSILYISHKLDEIQELCHAATVLRGGKVTANASRRRKPGVDGAADDRQGPAALRARRGETDGELRLRLAGLSHASDDPFGTDLRDIHLDVRAGEIVGIAGVSGNGQQELLRGSRRGAAEREDSRCRSAASRPAGSPGQRRKLGLAFVPRSASAAARCRACRSPTTRCSPLPQPACSPAASCASSARVISPSAASMPSTSRAAAPMRRPSRCRAATCRSSSSAARSCRRRSCWCAPAHLGRGRGRRHLHPPAHHRPARSRLRGAGDLGRARRAVRGSATASPSSPRAGCRPPAPRPRPRWRTSACG